MSKSFIQVFLVTHLLTGCAFGMGSRRPTCQIPKRTCKPILYLVEGEHCITYLENETEITKCTWDDDYPQDLTALTIKAYNCERNYQDELLMELKNCR
jgi:hypothetical protein